MLTLTIADHLPQETTNIKIIYVYALVRFLQTLLMEWRSILSDIGVPFRQELSLRQYLSTAKQRLEWQVTNIHRM